MRNFSYLLALTASAVSMHVNAAGFIEDSKTTISSRTLYFDNNNRESGSQDQRQTAQGFKADFSSGYTPGIVGFGLDAQAVAGFNLGGGIDHQTKATSNSFTPVDSDGTPVSNWSRGGANVKAKFSKSELVVGNALAPSLPILVINDGRLFPQSFGGTMLTIRDIPDVTLAFGKLTEAASRASSNYSGLAVSGGAKGSNDFQYGGGDWRPRNDLLLQYYHATLRDYYRQDFLGLTHLWKVDDGQSLKSEIRYFNNRSDGRVGTSNYIFNNFGGYASNLGEVKNNIWSATLTYAASGHTVLVGHQRVSDDGSMVYVNNGSVRDGKSSLEGQAGASFYMYTDQMINSFIRAGENTTYAQYGYDFAAQGAPGLKASIIYLHGEDIIDKAKNGSTYSEWERDMKIDYVIQSGSLKGLGFSLRRANFRTGVPTAQGAADTDQTRFYLNYSYSLK